MIELANWYTFGDSHATSHDHYVGKFGLKGRAGRDRDKRNTLQPGLIRHRIITGGKRERRQDTIHDINILHRVEANRARWETFIGPIGYLSM